MPGSAFFSVSSTSWVHVGAKSRQWRQYGEKCSMNLGCGGGTIRQRIRLATLLQYSPNAVCYRRVKVIRGEHKEFRLGGLDRESSGGKED